MGLMEVNMKTILIFIGLTGASVYGIGALACRTDLISADHNVTLA